MNPNRCRRVVTKEVASKTVAMFRAAGAGPGGRPDYWPGGVRHGGGMSLVCGSRAEHGKARVDTARRGREGAATGIVLVV